MGEFNYDQLNKTLGEMIARASNPEPALREVGLLGVGEMQKNIEAGGRRESWPPSIRVKVSGGQTLRDSGLLYNSISFRVSSPSVSIGPGGAVSKYAAILAKGGTIKAKNKPYLRFFIRGVGWTQKKEVTIPARDYTFIPQDAQTTMGEIVSRFVLGR
jgi:phage gpG-like protein